MATREEILKRFHKAFGVEIDEEPTVKLLRHRQELLEEEVKELSQDIDKAAKLLDTGQKVPKELYANILKEMADVQSILSGTSVAIRPLRRLEEAFLRVHESNMSKLGRDGKPVKREDGKVLKGPNYQEPNLNDLI